MSLRENVKKKKKKKRKDFSGLFTNYKEMFAE